MGKRERNAVRKIMRRHLSVLLEDESFGVTGDKIDAAVVTAEDDTGQWSPDARVIVYTEATVIPDPVYGGPSWWEKVDEDLRAVGLWSEPINSAVVSIWPLSDLSD